MKIGKTAIIVLVTVACSFCYSAKSSTANEIIHRYWDADTHETYVLEKDEYGNLYLWEVSAKNTWHSVMYVSAEGNPNPADGSGGGAPSAESLKDFIRKHHKGKLSKGVQENNPYSLKQSGQGKGLTPIWNPSEQANDVDGGGSGSGGPGTNSGNTAEWVKSMAKKGSGSDDEESSNNNSDNDRSEIGTTGSIHPERVFPVPYLSETSVQTKSLETGEMALPTKGFNMSRVSAAVHEMPNTSGIKPSTPMVTEKPNIKSKTSVSSVAKIQKGDKQRNTSGNQGQKIHKSSAAPIASNSTVTTDRQKFSTVKETKKTIHTASSQKQSTPTKVQVQQTNQPSIKRIVN